MLYSNQLQKKTKSWTDGYLYYLVARKKAVLLDETGKVLDSVQPANAGDLQGDRELKMESYVVTVDGDPIDEPKGFNKPALPEVETSINSVPKSATSRLYAILYTRDKAKKAKTWHDGHLALNGNMVSNQAGSPFIRK